MPLPQDQEGRLAQLEALPRLIDSLSAQRLHTAPPSGGWSVHQQLAHLARHHDVFLKRLERILTEDTPVLDRYRAEDDPDWPSWASLPTDEIRRRLQGLRAEIVSRLSRLSPSELERRGVHPTFGPMSVIGWLDHFLLHEAHHLYRIVVTAGSSPV